MTPQNELEALRMSLYRAAQVAKLRPEVGLDQLSLMVKEPRGWNSLAAEVVAEIERLQAHEDSPTVKLNELHSLVLAEQGRTLTKHEQRRYVELVEQLQAANIEIPFGIEI